MTSPGSVGLPSFNALPSSKTNLSSTLKQNDFPVLCIFLKEGIDF